MSDESQTQPTPIKGDWSDVDPRWGIRTTPAMVMQLELAEDEYITGEEFDHRRDGSFMRFYPSVERAAKKYGVPVRLLEEIAVRNQWEQHRKRFQEMLTSELRSIQAKVQAQTSERLVEMIDKALHDFGKCVLDEQIAIGSFQEFERLIRLRSFVEGKADKRIEHQHGVMSFAEIQARYRGVQAEIAEETLQMTGLLVDESAIDSGDKVPPPDLIKDEAVEVD